MSNLFDCRVNRFGSRDMLPEAGRWLSADPLLFRPAMPNAYHYCISNPLNCIDPGGLAEIVLSGCSTQELDVAVAINDPGAVNVNGHRHPMKGEPENGTWWSGSRTCVRERNGNVTEDWMTREDLLDRIKNHPSYSSATHINLFMCGAANPTEYGESIAAYIARETGKPVLASFGFARANQLGPSGFNLQFWFVPGG